MSAAYRITSPTAVFDAPHDYNSHFLPGKASLYHPLVLYHWCIHSIQYQPGKYLKTYRAAPVMWMPGPTPVPSCPFGLAYLAQLNNIHILQHFEPLEYQMVYIVTENTYDYTRNAYRNLRPFILRVTLEVQCPPGVAIGFVAEHWNLCRDTYSIQNQRKENEVGVRGPCATYGCGSDPVFERIIRKWNGFLSTMGDADHFEIRFPLNLDVKMKAMIFGACFLIDFMYFERTPSRCSSR
ncbi:Plscr4 [Phodopus roborovskii]|uniref:Phospholipid scramblase n=1 Tax=Phodopus roborovskii TaxID=109678 RepID=A0AAU9YT75_PHORO|nr:Plscr4 [Phodopus roborovskii]